MVLDLYVEDNAKNEDYSISCAYSGFTYFRCELLRGWNENLAELYEIYFSDLMERERTYKTINEKEISEYMSNKSLTERKIKQILDEYDKPYNKGMKLFIYHSDCDGEFTPSECELILKSFGRVDPNKFDKNDIHFGFYNMMYKKWKKMMAFAIEINKNIIFG